MTSRQTDAERPAQADVQGSPGPESAVTPWSQEIRTNPSAVRSNRAVVLLVFALILGVYGLLWSAWWYPASDSALYVTVARNLAEGRGYTYMDRPHRQVPPLTPLLLWGSLQVSRSFGMANATMIACMIGGLVFMYLTLRQWLDYRIALALTAGSALTYWQFRLATILGSDQPFFLLFWIALLCFTKAFQQPGRRPAWLASATTLLLVGMGFRIASFLFVPMVAVALWMEYRRAIPTRAKRGLLICTVAMPFLLAGGTYWLWGRQARGPHSPRELVQLPHAPPCAVGSLSSSSTSDSGFLETGPSDAVPSAASPDKGITHYRLTPRLRMADLPKLPGLVGRWIAELLLVPAREVFQRLPEGRQAMLGLPIALLALAGLIRQGRAGNWWIVLPILYMLMITYMWGFRVIPRYLTPVLPMVLLWMATGCGWAVAAGAGLLGLGQSPRQRLTRAVELAIPILVIAGNLPVLAVELYARHHGDFYQDTRQGAWAELVDAAAVIRHNLPPDTVVCTNDPMLRREIHLLTGRAIAATAAPLPVRSPNDEPALRLFFQQTGAKYAVIRFYDNGWPEWHMSLRNPQTPRTWWGLYTWDADRGGPLRIALPANRDWLRCLPDSAI